MQTKKNIAWWALYDFGNSIVLMAFLFYFSQWLVIDQGNPSWWYNATLIGSSILFIFTAPFISKKIDTNGKKLGGLRFWSAATFVGFLVTALITLFADHLDGVAALVYTFATYAYLICFLYYTPMLNNLSTSENSSSVSGFGQAANSAGQVVGLLVTLPFVTGAIVLFGDPGRAQALLPAVVLFGVCSLPMLLAYREETVTPAASSRGDLSPFSGFASVFKHRSLALLLVAYFLFSDAMLTFANNFPLYLEKVHEVSDTFKALLTVGILTLAAVGAIIFGKLADRIGTLKTLTGVLIVWCVLFPLMTFVSDLNILVGIFLIAGIFFGPVWGLSRSAVGQVAPPALVASSYGYYVVAERFATFVGPALWSIILVTLGDGSLGYRVALLSMSVLVVISLFVLRKIKR